MGFASERQLNPLYHDASPGIYLFLYLRAFFQATVFYSANIEAVHGKARMVVLLGLTFNQQGMAACRLTSHLPALQTENSRKHLVCVFKVAEDLAFLIAVLVSFLHYSCVLRFFSLSEKKKETKISGFAFAETQLNTQRDQFRLDRHQNRPNSLLFYPFIRPLPSLPSQNRPSIFSSF